MNGSGEQVRKSFEFCESVDDARRYSLICDDFSLIFGAIDCAELLAHGGVLDRQPESFLEISEGKRKLVDFLL